jgi:two-component system nitrogen regulation response regulator NtrX
MKTVLIVEDDEGVRDSLAYVLSDAGYDIIQSGNGADAIRLAARADLMILDIALPDASGNEVLRDLREAGCRIPVIVISGVIPQEGAERLMGSLDVAEFLEKPLNPCVVRQKVYSTLNFSRQIALIADATRRLKAFAKRQAVH